MSLLRARYCWRGLSVLLAFLIWLGGLSVMSGLCLRSGPERAEIGLDVCHPLQAANLAANVTIARPAAALSMPTIALQGLIVERPVAGLLDLIFTPDPPPPKALG